MAGRRLSQGPAELMQYCTPSFPELKGLSYNNGEQLCFSST